MHSVRRGLAVLALIVAATVLSVGASSTWAKTHKKKAASALSGKWEGQYGGAYHGTFSLNWHQSGSTLSGTIKLSNPASTLTVHGSLHGKSISFGTVGGAAITYTGSVSGKSMSGKYETPGGGGPWSAKKTS